MTKPLTEKAFDEVKQVLEVRGDRNIYPDFVRALVATVEQGFAPEPVDPDEQSGELMGLKKGIPYGYKEVYVWYREEWGPSRNIEHALEFLQWASKFGVELGIKCDDGNIEVISFDEYNDGTTTRVASLTLERSADDFAEAASILTEMALGMYEKQSEEKDD